MSLRLYNTLSRQLEEFKPISTKQVGLYTCGPTVYSTAHIGNLRTYIFEDVLRRTLEFNGYTVKHVMNVTDVGHLTDDADMGEDKMELSAKQQKKSASEIAAEHEAEFFRDCKSLNIERPHVILRATETINLQIELIQKLEAKGVTYKTSDGIYFDTSKFPRYGQLSGQKPSDKKAGARVEVNQEKKHPADFALWKFSKPNEKRQMEWPSPWGTGFPGWHIECSAMSMHELGEQFDIHTGGVDHIPVHHENEIAQSEAATGKHPFVRYWLHGEFLKLPGKRMGKSEGNATLLSKLSVPALAYRYLVLQAQYRKPLDFTQKSLEAAAQGLNSIWALIDNHEQESKHHSSEIEPTFVKRFQDAINDDLNTSKALAILQELLRSDHDWDIKRATIGTMDEVFGLDLLEKRAQVTGLDSLLEEYETARREKRYTVSDKLRKEIEAKGAIVEDLPDGTSRLRKA